MAAVAPTAYCLVADLTTLGVPLAALSGVDLAIQQACVDGANAEADSYLGNIFTLPLSQWGRELTKFCVAIAVYDIFVTRGFDPGSPDLAEQIRDRAKDARSWFRLVAEGKATPSGVVDSSPSGSTPASGGPGGLFVTQATIQPSNTPSPAGAARLPGSVVDGDSGGSFTVQVGRPSLRGW